MKLRIAISPCPNDTFIFGALALNLIDPYPFQLDFEYYDINILNKMAETGNFDIIKMSYVQSFYVENHYHILRAGGAMGYGCGPLLISKKVLDDAKSPNLRIAVPGFKTTANFLLTNFFDGYQNLEELRFDQIEDALLDDQIDAGVIIHESRFTFEQKGLKLVQDLGQYWEQNTNCPIPLGCIGMHNRWNKKDLDLFNQLIVQSIEFANNHPESIKNYINLHAFEMAEDVLQSHIDLYVNDFSKDIGDEGEAAIRQLRWYCQSTMNKV